MSFNEEHAIYNEETALLDAAGKKRVKRVTPLPKLQVFIVMMTLLAEPMSATSLLPFINQMIAGFDIVNGDPARVGYYVGLMVSCFYLAEALTILHWSRLSDRIGRKPVLLMGLAGNALSILLFGLSRSFWPLVFCRCLCGLLNGNVGVAKSAIGDMTDSTNMAQAFAFIPVMWATGVTIAPFMGGTLQHPAERFPALFDSPFWLTYPYFLPCLVAGVYSAIAFSVVFFLFEETLPSSSPARRPPSRAASVSPSETAVGTPDTASLAAAIIDDPSLAKEEPIPLRTLIRNRNVLLAIAMYGLLGMQDIAYATLQPLFFSTPIPLGGLALDPPTIGIVLGAFGLCNGFYEAFAFAPIVRRTGTKPILVAGMSAFVLMYALCPLLNWVAYREGGVTPVVWVILGVQLAVGMIMEMSFGTAFMYVNAASPNKHSLGAVNGLSQLIASCVRAIGPSISSALFAVSVERHWLHGYAVYVVLILLCLGAVRVTLLAPKEPWGSERDE